MAIASYPHTFLFRFGAKETRHKGDGYDNHRFFDRKNSFHPYRAVPTGNAARRNKRQHRYKRGK